jgi:hypothetical protein
MMAYKGVSQCMQEKHARERFLDIGMRTNFRGIKEEMVEGDR